MALQLTADSTQLVGARMKTGLTLAVLLALPILALSIAAPALATPVISAGNLPFSGISPGGVNMATGELILVMRPDLVLCGPHPVPWFRYYASMLQREGLASSRLGPNWLGTYDWKLTVTPSNATLITNRGEAIRFASGPGGSWNLSSPTYAPYKLDQISGGVWRFTNPIDRHLYFFDGVTWLLTQILDEHGNALNLTYAVGGGPLSQVTDGLGRTLTFGYEPTTGLLSQVSDGTRNVTYSYTGGILSSFIDAAGKPSTITRDPGPIQNLITGIHEPMGNAPFTNSYDPLGRVASQMDALGHSASYSYDTPTGNVYTDPSSNAWTYQHDPQKLTTLKDPNAGNTNFFYDPLGRLSSFARPMGDPTSYDYDPASGYVGTVHFADGTMVSFDHGPHVVAGAQIFDVTAEHDPDGTNAIFNRDAAGNLMTYLDRAGFPWNGTYNSRGQVLTWTNPGNGAATGTTTFTYDPQGRLATVRDNAGNTASYGYDALGRVSQINWPGTTHRQFTYDNLDNLTLIGDESGNPWSYAYDDNGRLQTSTDPLLHSTGFVYDGMDRVSQVSDPLGHAALYDYDLNGRLFHFTDRSGRVTTYQYDALNRLQNVSDPAGAPSSFGYDGDSRLIFAQDALGHSESFQYDLLDRLTKVTDPVLSEFNVTNDAMGRVKQITGPLGFFQSFTYDPRGLLASSANGSSVTQFQYTPHGMLSQITDPNTNAWLRSYDPQGRLTGASDPLGRSYGYQYDELSRVMRVTRPDLTAENFTYDANGNLTGRNFTDGTSFTYGYDIANWMTNAPGYSFTYDNAGRMTASNGFSYARDQDGRILSETLSPGKTVNYTYDPRGLPSGVSDWLTGSTSFTYDAAHRFTGMTRANGTSVTYQYDNADRMTSAVEVNPGPLQISSIQITRDALGRTASINRRQPLMPGSTMPASSSFSYDVASQMNGVSHDALARTTVDGTRALSWNGASQLTSYSKSGADSLNYTDDGSSNPTKIAPHTGNVNAIQLSWGYGRGYPTVDDFVVQVPSRWRLNVHGPTGLLLYGVDGNSGARSFYHYDEAGNTAFLTNDGGNVTTEYAYGPFGGVSALGQTTDNLFTFGAARGMMALTINGVSTGLWQDGGGVYDERTMREVSGLATQSGEKQPGPPGYSWKAPGPGGSPGLEVIVNFEEGDPDQPLQVPVGSWRQPGPQGYSWRAPGPNGYSWKDPGPIGIGPGPQQTGWVNPGPQQTGWVNPGPLQTGWRSPGPIQSEFMSYSGNSGLNSGLNSGVDALFKSASGLKMEQDVVEYGEGGMAKSRPPAPRNRWEFLEAPMNRPPPPRGVEEILPTAAQGPGPSYTPKPTPWVPVPSLPSPFELVNHDMFTTIRPIHSPCSWCPQ
jgi:YD repeat-containing protein